MEDDFDEEAIYSPAVAKKAKTAAPVAPINPLAAYFRLPGISVKLPTGGRFLPKGALEMNDKGEIEVYPMRAADEILLKSPDALMSGLAVERMVGSCVPALKTPKLISAPDLDVILLAIKAASSGTTMAIEVQCPKCEQENTFDADLAAILATVKPLPDVLEVRLADDLVVSIKPHCLDEQTRLLISAYEQNRRTQLLDMEDNELTDDEKQDILRETLNNVEHLQHQSLVNAIEYITIRDQKVVDRGMLMEFLAKTTNEFLTAIRKKIEEVNNMGIDRSVKAQCQKCKHKWKTQIEFNPSTFFGQGSSD